MGYLTYAEVPIKMVVERLEALITKKEFMAVLRMIPEANVAARIGSRSIQRNGFCCRMYVDVLLINTGPSGVEAIRNEIE